MISADMSTATKPTPELRFWGRLGPLRIMMMIAVAVIILAAPFADGTTHAHDWRLLPGVVAPSVMMMLVFAIPLDITMARVFMADANDDERDRLRFVIRVELIAYVLMLAAWMPFMFRVLEFNPFG